MKKLMIFLACFLTVFAICAVGITCYMIQKYENSIQEQKVDSTSKQSDKEIDSHKEITYTSSIGKQGIDFTTFYDENDLKVVDKKVEIERGTFTVPQIEGLKNKEIEKRVNDDIIKRILIYAEGREDCEPSWYQYYVTANFSNVISIRFGTIEKDEPGFFSGRTLDLNYELVQGTRLSLEDVFTKEVDLKTILRTSVYNTLMRYNAYYSYWDFSPFTKEYEMTEEEIKKQEEDFQQFLLENPTLVEEMRRF